MCFANGQLFIADRSNDAVRVYDCKSGDVSTLMRRKNSNYVSSHMITLLSTTVIENLSDPMSLCFDTTGNLLLADCGNHRILCINVKKREFSVLVDRSAGFH